MIEQAFNVLTEFRFEVGHAVTESGKLQSAVEGISDAAAHAQLKLQSIGVGFLSQFSAGGAGLLGALYTAIKASDKFRQSQISIANLMNDGVSTFDERLLRAAGTMDKINKLASEFALPADDLLALTKVVAPMIRHQGPGGKIGAPDFNTAIDLSRNLMKAAPTLGVDTTQIMGEVQRAISGGASMNDTFFRRLIADTKTMHGMSSSGFNAMPETKRVETMTKALREFTSDASVLAANVKTLNGQMTLLKNNIGGVFSALRPIGDVLLQTIIPVLQGVNKYIHENVSKIANSLSRLIEPWIADTRSMIATFAQLKNFKSDFHAAGRIIGIVGTILGAAHALEWLGIEIPIVTAALRAFSHGMSTLEGDLLKKSLNAPLMNAVKSWGSGGFFAGILSVLFRIGNGIVVFVSRLFVPFLLLLGLFQLLSRAMAYAKIFAAEKILAAMPRITEALAIFSRVWGIFGEGFDNIARAMGAFLDPSLLFGCVDAISLLTRTLELLGKASAFVMASIQGIFFVIFEFFNQLKSLVTLNGFSFSKIGDAWNYALQDTFEKVFGNKETKVANQVTNINGGITIQNTFKEQIEPDRIAFTIKEQLLKAATNRGQAAGRTMRPEVGSV